MRKITIVDDTMVNHDDMTMETFFIFCKNAKEISEKYGIDDDIKLRDFLKTNFKDEYGYSHHFYVVEDKQNLYTIDELIYDTIMLLNQCGYKTRFSCQGNKKGTHAYISFDEQLTMEQKEDIFILTSLMLKKGLVVVVDRGWESNRMVIRWEKSCIAGTYYDNPFVGQWDKLINALMHEAVYEFVNRK